MERNLPSPPAKKGVSRRVQAKLESADSPAARASQLQALERDSIDRLDALHLESMPPEYAAAARPLVEADAAALAREGGRGAAAKRILASDIALTRARLRYLDGLLHGQLDAVMRGDGTAKRFHILSQEAHRSSQRLQAGLALLARLGNSVPAVHIHAVKAAVAVDCRGKPQ